LEVQELLADEMPADKVTALAEKLSQGTWTHDHPIGLRHAQELGLPVRSDMPTEFYEMMALFPSRRNASPPCDTSRPPTAQLAER
jgi:hypothetical protein